MGSNVYNRLSTKLHKGKVRNPVDTWIRRDNAFKAIVPIAHYAQAQKVMQSRCRHLSDDEMLDHLKWLLKRAGKLTAKVINEDKTTPGACAYQKHFESLTRAYGLIGYEQELQGDRESPQQEPGSNCARTSPRKHSTLRRKAGRVQIVTSLRPVPKQLKTFHDLAEKLKMPVEDLMRQSNGKVSPSKLWSKVWARNWKSTNHS